MFVIIPTKQKINYTIVLVYSLYAMSALVKNDSDYPYVIRSRIQTVESDDDDIERYDRVFHDGDGDDDNDIDADEDEDGDEDNEESDMADQREEEEEKKRHLKRNHVHDLYQSDARFDAVDIEAMTRLRSGVDDDGLLPVHFPVQLKILWRTKPMNWIKCAKTRWIDAWKADDGTEVDGPHAAIARSAKTGRAISLPYPSIPLCLNNEIVSFHLHFHLPPMLLSEFAMQKEHRIQINGLPLMKQILRGRKVPTDQTSIENAQLVVPLMITLNEYSTKNMPYPVSISMCTPSCLLSDDPTAIPRNASQIPEEKNWFPCHTGWSADEKGQAVGPVLMPGAQSLI
ncbi:MAG TPA: hypothetical protein VEF04_19910, partial [Blastocatellia bacterium]|nr:hypothetical protein [Blastocatellia bacterium]